jgi:hypothetical protein
MNWTEPPTCEDGYRTDRTTRDGLPICPYCRRRTLAQRKARAARTTESSGANHDPSAPQIDHAALAAHDLDLLDHLEDE